VLVPLAKRLAATAPNIQLEILQPNEESVPGLERGKLDLLITPEPYLAAWHPSELLFEEEQVVVGWAQNPVFKHGLTEADFYAAGHVTVAMGSARTPAFADSHLQHLAHNRRVEVAVASFASAPWFLVGTSRLAVLHQRLARAMAPMFDLAVAPVPFAFPRLREMIQFHEARAQDAGLKWLRAELIEVARGS
jgi:DNA-binding transcriptional LysR family regulator